MTVDRKSFAGSIECEPWQSAHVAAFVSPLSRMLPWMECLKDSRASPWQRPHVCGRFARLTVDYFMDNTGIPVNFGIAVALGFIVGTAIAGQTFYNFTLDNLRHFGTLKAMGTSNGMLLGMILLQALVVGSIGYGLGVGAASLFGALLGHTELAFRLPWQLLGLSAAAITCICLSSAVISIRKVMQIEPAIVFKG